MSPAGTRKSHARQRILETAERLFYAEGVRAVGIDRIIAEAGVAKMTLYNHFASKDDLILGVLEYRETIIDNFFTDAMARHGKKSADALDAFFAALKEWFESPGFRGCAFINASVELADAGHPASQFSAAHKRRFHEMLTGVITETAGESAGRLGPAIALLVEGAIVSALMEQSPEPAETAKAAARALVATAAKAKRR